MFAVVEKLLTRDLVFLVNRVDADFFQQRDALAGVLGRNIQSEVDDELIGLAPLKNGPATVSPLKALSETQSSDFLITGPLSGSLLATPSTETMFGAYIVRITSKFFPCLHNSTNFWPTVRTRHH